MLRHFRQTCDYQKDNANMSLISEFKAFAVRGNVVDMAVGIIIGAAFGPLTCAYYDFSDAILPPEDVANVIALDPAVSTNVLRIVNSAYYGLQVRVSSIGLAVSIMGFSMTKKVALKAAVFSVFARSKSRLENFDPVGFWRHSIFTGVAARVLGRGLS